MGGETTPTINTEVLQAKIAAYEAPGASSDATKNPSVIESLLHSDNVVDEQAAINLYDLNRQYYNSDEARVRLLYQGIVANRPEFVDHIMANWSGVEKFIEEHEDVKILLNKVLSSYDIKRRELVDDLKAELKEQGIEPGRIMTALLESLSKKTETASNLNYAHQRENRKLLQGIFNYDASKDTIKAWDFAAVYTMITLGAAGYVCTEFGGILLGDIGGAGIKTLAAGLTLLAITGIVAIAWGIYKYKQSAPTRNAEKNYFGEGNEPSKKLELTDEQQVDVAEISKLLRSDEVEASEDKTADAVLNVPVTMLNAVPTYNSVVAVPEQAPANEQSITLTLKKGA